MVIAIGAVVLGLTSTSSVSADLSSKSAPNDPLREFDTFVQRGLAAPPPAAHVHFNHQKKGKNQKGEWIRTVWSIKDVKFDVHKTESLVSPFVAYVTFQVVAYLGTYKTEEDARASMNPREAKPSELISLVRLEYAYQGATWRVISGASDLREIADMHGGRLQGRVTDAGGLHWTDPFTSPVIAAWLSLVP